MTKAVHLCLSLNVYVNLTVLANVKNISVHLLELRLKSYRSLHFSLKYQYIDICCMTVCEDKDNVLLIRIYSILFLSN